MPTLNPHGRPSPAQQPAANHSMSHHAVETTAQVLRIPVPILRDLRTNHNAKHVVFSHLGSRLLLRIVGGCNHRLPMEAYHLLQHSCFHMAIISIPYLTLLNANDTYVDSQSIWRLIGGCDSPAENFNQTQNTRPPLIHDIPSPPQAPCCRLRVPATKTFASGIASPPHFPLRHSPSPSPSASSLKP